MNSVQRPNPILVAFACLAAVSLGCIDATIGESPEANDRLAPQSAGTSGRAGATGSSTDPSGTAGTGATGVGASGSAGTGNGNVVGASGATGTGGAPGVGAGAAAGTAGSVGSGKAGAGGASGAGAGAGGAGVAGAGVAGAGVAGAGGSSVFVPDAGGMAGATVDSGGQVATDAGTGTSNTAWRPFSAASPWNTPIASNAKLAPDSAALISDFATSSQWPFMTVNIETYSVPVYFVDATTPLQTVKATTVGGLGFDQGSAQVPIPAGAQPAAGTDQHLAIVNKQTNQEWGMWAAANSSSGWTCAVCATADLTGLGARPPTQNPPWWMGHGARACGFPLIAGLITVDEMRAGSIEHALAIAYPHIRSRYYVEPASTAQPTTDQAIGTRGVPCGGRMQLDPSLNLDQMGLSASGKIIARALQKYGAFVADFSGAMSLYADASPAAQAAWKGGLLTTYEIKDVIGLGKFRVLEMGTLYDNAN